MRYEPLETYADTLRRFHRAGVDHELDARSRLENAWAAVEEQRQLRVLTRWRTAAALLRITAVDFLIIGIALSLLVADWPKPLALNDLFSSVVPGLTVLGVWLLRLRRRLETDPTELEWLGGANKMRGSDVVRSALRRRRQPRSANSKQSEFVEISEKVFFAVVSIGNDPLHRFRRTTDRPDEDGNLPLICLPSISQAVAHATAMERSGIQAEDERCNVKASRTRLAMAERQLVRIEVDRLRVLDARVVHPTRLPLAQLMELARKGGGDGLVLPTLLSPEDNLLMVLPEAITDYVRVLDGKEIKLPVEADCTADSEPKWLSDDQTVAAILSEAMATEDFDSWLDDPNPYFSGEPPRTVLTPQDRIRFQAIATRQVPHEG